MAIVIGKQAGQAALLVAGIGVGFDVAQKLWNREEVQKIRFSDQNDYKKKVKGILKNIREEKIDLRDVVFLAPKKYKNSMLAVAGIEVNELSDRFDGSVNLPVYAMIQGFKGLDAKIVILTDIEGSVK